MTRWAWSVGLLVIIGAAYYADSRIEVQQYEYSCTARCSCWRRRWRWRWLLQSIRRAGFAPRLGRTRAAETLLSGLVAVAILAGLAFTFAHFDKNQNLKTQVFYRTTQTKQYFKLAQCVGLRRDGYSAFSGGGTETIAGATSIRRNRNCWRRRRQQLRRGRPDARNDRRLAAPVRGAQRSFKPKSQTPECHLLLYRHAASRSSRSYGYNRNTTPNIDKLAARSSVFRNAYTPSPYTYECCAQVHAISYWTRTMRRGLKR